MRDGIMYDQKDIVLIPFPYSDLTGSKKRPALIISNHILNKSKDRICCLVTTKSHQNDVEINRNSFEKDTLPFKSFVRPHRIFTIHEGIIIKKICTVTEDFHEKVISKLYEYIKRG